VDRTPTVGNVQPLTNDKTTVLYLGGAGRSGSTVIERLLASTGGCFCAGELRWIWDRGVRQNQLCSCGNPFRSCDFWIEVFDHAFGGIESADVNEMEELRLTLDRLRFIPALNNPRMRTHNLELRIAKCGEILSSLYQSIKHVSGSAYVIDSSKDASYAFLLAANPQIDLRLIHLVRDSRAVAFSWQRRKIRPEITDRVQYMDQFPPRVAASNWTIANIAVGHLQKKLDHSAFLRYEDFVKDPEILTRLLADLGLLESSKIDDPTPEREILWHTVSGNPMRFRKGNIDIVADQQWRGKIDANTFNIVTGMTLPLLLRYKYALKPRPSSLVS
jgi:hypothetical protein